MLAARREDRIRQLAEELGDAVAVQCDVTEPGQVTEAVRAGTEAFGRIDILVNNAGQGLQAGVEEIDPDDFRANLDLHLVAPLRAIQAVTPVMREQGAGSIVNVNSGTSLLVIPGPAPTPRPRQGSTSFARSRAELAEARTVVATVYPFITATEFLDSIRAGHEAAARLEHSHGPQPHTLSTAAEN